MNEERERHDPATRVEPSQVKRSDGGPVLPVVLLILALFMLATGRWGSYMRVPDAPFFVGDALLAVAIGIAGWRLAARRLSLGALSSTPYVLRASGVLLVWALLRFLIQPEFTFDAFRDLAPFAYASTALLAFVAPLRRAKWIAPLVYGALAVHAAWFIPSARGWIDSSRLLALGPRGTTLFSTRPDFDATVFAIGVGLAMHALLFKGQKLNPWHKLGWTCLLFVNAWGALSQHTRAGLLANLAVVCVVFTIWVRQWSTQRRALRRAVRRGLPLLVAVGLVAVSVLALLFTLPGQRLLEGFDGSGGESAGTASARVFVYGNLSEYLLQEPGRTVIGVGFGPDFLRASGTLAVLEGTTYDGVRSPHNFLLGVWARLGIVAAFLAASVLLMGALLAMWCLPVAREPADVLAALIVLALPIPAMLGVILESPFGALPYFWALGHLCSRQAVLGARRLEASVARFASESKASPAAHRLGRGWLFHRHQTVAAQRALRCWDFCQGCSCRVAHASGFPSASWRSP